MKKKDDYYMKPYFMSDDDIDIILAISKRLSEGIELGEYFTLQFRILAFRLESIREKMRKEFE
nr:unnamed protein product [uncultured bacterium]